MGKSQLKGQITLSLESVTSRMYRCAGVELYGEPYRSLDEMLALDRRDRPRSRSPRCAREFFAPERQTVVSSRPRRRSSERRRAAYGTAHSQTEHCSMKIGVPKEIKTNENRIALVPAGAETLVGAGHSVLIETGAGVGSGFTDEDYTCRRRDDRARRRRRCGATAR